MSKTRVSDGLTWRTHGGYTIPVAPRDPTLHPFTHNSVWNLPIADSATFESASDPVTAMLIDPAFGVWVNQAQYSHPVFYASWDDTVARVTDGNSASRSGTFYIPTEAIPAVGSDGHMHIIHPSKRFIDECIGVGRVSDVAYNTSRHQRVDLYGDGLGPQNGVRAYGGSAIGGLIRDWESNPAHPLYTGVINHALAFALDNDQQYYNTGTAGFDSSGYLPSTMGYVWPATEQDFAGSSIYNGVVPMGTYCAIPPSVDINSLGLTTTAGLMMARALQDYGAYNTDTSTLFTFYVETHAKGSFRSELQANNQAELKKLRAQLRVVTNNSISTPNGGALGSARRQPLAAALAV